MGFEQNKTYFSLWEYCFNKFYIKWINILKPPQFIFKLDEKFSFTIISDDKNNPENNFIEFGIDLENGRIGYIYINKFGELVKKGKLF